MFLLVIFVISFFIFMGKLRTGRFFNPLSFYLTFWGTWILFSMGNPYELYEVSEKTYFIILLSLFCFGLGCILIDIPKIQIKDSIVKNDESYKFLGSRIFLITQFIVFAILFVYYLKYSSLMSSLPLDYQRRIVYEVGLLFTTTYEMLFYNWVLKPIMTISVIMTISNYVIYGKKNISLIIAFLNCILFSMVGNGRLIFFDLLIFILVAVAFKKSFSKQNPIPKWHIRKSTINKSILFSGVIAVLIYVMNSTSVKRLGLENPSLVDMWDTFVNYSLQQGIVYFVGPLRALDNFLTLQIADSVGYTFGRATFGGIEEIFASLMSSFFGDPTWALNSANIKTASFTVPPIQIGSDQTFNALYTNIMNFYLDAGVTGVIVMSLLFGITSGLVFKYCLNNTNIFKISLLVYYTHHLIVSEFRWDYQSPATWVIILLFVFLIKKYQTSKVKNSVPKTRKRIKIVW
ncbi:hypothetical protein IIO_06207 [Bacillus cereus VD115]|nr:hypothetical protein IIO_06207 [Bacillus cereus VD115]